jgi:hypothetical protein
MISPPIKTMAVVSLFALVACGVETTPVSLVQDPGPQALYDPYAISDGETFIGDIRINSQTDLDQFLDYKRIDGHVAIGSEYLSELIWAKLQKIDGYLFIWENPALKNIELSSLREVGGTLLIRENNKLTEASFPALEKIGGTLSIVYNQRLSNCVVEDITTDIGSSNVAEGVYAQGNYDEPGC